MSFVAAWVLLFYGAHVLTNAGAPHFALVLYPLPVALSLVQGSPSKFFLWLLNAASVAYFNFGTFESALYYLAFAGTGSLLGFALRRGWTFTQATLTFTVGIFGYGLALLIPQWELARTRSVALLEQWAARYAADSDYAEEMREAVSAGIQWMAQHWSDVVVGFFFGAALLYAAVNVSVFRFLTRRLIANPPTISPFYTFRPNDYLVWLAIATVIVVYIERFHAQPVLRFVAWNLAVALASVYWLNGLAITAFALHAFASNAWLYISTLFFVIFLFVNQAHPLWVTLGFFDLWVDWRRLLQRWSARPPTNSLPPSE